MEKYIHKVHYYETDKMGITHHSNYIRWMEEARVDYLEKIGWGYDKLEELGIGSPVIGIKCDYKNSTKFNDNIEIEVKIKEYKGVRMTITYEMKNKETNQIVLIGESRHCFTNQEGKPIILKKQCPEFDEVFNGLCE
ncbi:MAG: acyl-CoA thioesterase [Clostridia bacterium]|nr:acyl-CoA thioesterase [Clostridia bacterium]